MVRSTDSLDMSIAAVDWDIKPQTNHPIRMQSISLYAKNWIGLSSNLTKNACKVSSNRIFITVSIESGNHSASKGQNTFLN